MKYQKTILKKYRKRLKVKNEEEDHIISVILLKI